MAWIETTDAESAGGVRKMLALGIERFHGGFLPGIYRILLVDLKLLAGMGWLYRHLHLGNGSSLSTTQKEMLATVVNGKIDGAPWLGQHTAAVRRLTGEEHLNADFATEWPEYDLDRETRALLSYATKVTESPAQVTEDDVEQLRDAGWDEEAIYRATALVSMFNCSGRMEAVSGLPPDEIPEDAAYWGMIEG